MTTYANNSRIVDALRRAIELPAGITNLTLRLSANGIPVVHCTFHPEAVENPPPDMRMVHAVQDAEARAYRAERELASTRNALRLQSEAIEAKDRARLARRKT